MLLLMLIMLNFVFCLMLLLMFWMLSLFLCLMFLLIILSIILVKRMCGWMLWIFFCVIVIVVNMIMCWCCVVKCVSVLLWVRWIWVDVLWWNCLFGLFSMLMWWIVWWWCIWCKWVILCVILSMLIECGLLIGGLLFRVKVVLFVGFCCVGVYFMLGVFMKIVNDVLF